MVVWNGGTMERALWFVGGIAVGVMLGSRAGREPYDRVVGGARRAWESPHVQDTARMVQARAAHLYDEGVRRLTPNGKAVQDETAPDREDIAAS
jgi:hypothetical protein